MNVFIGEIHRDKHIIRSIFLLPAVTLLLCYSSDVMIYSNASNNNSNTCIMDVLVWTIAGIYNDIY